MKGRKKPELPKYAQQSLELDIQILEGPYQDKCEDETLVCPRILLKSQQQLWQKCHFAGIKDSLAEFAAVRHRPDSILCRRESDNFWRTTFALSSVFSLRTAVRFLCCEGDIQCSFLYLQFLMRIQRQMVQWYACVVMISSITNAFAADVNEFIVFGNSALPGRLYIPPEAATSTEPRPLILFLHGAGETGSNNRDQVNGNINNLLDNAKLQAAVYQ